MSHPAFERMRGARRRKARPKREERGVDSTGKGRGEEGGRQKPSWEPPRAEGVRTHADLCGDKRCANLQSRTGSLGKISKEKRKAEESRATRSNLTRCSHCQRRGRVVSQFTCAGAQGFFKVEASPGGKDEVPGLLLGV